MSVVADNDTARVDVVVAFDDDKVHSHRGITHLNEEHATTSSSLFIFALMLTRLPSCNCVCIDAYGGGRCGVYGKDGGRLVADLNCISIDADAEQRSTSSNKVDNVLLVKTSGIVVRTDLIVVGGGSTTTSTSTLTTLSFSKTNQSFLSSPEKSIIYIPAPLKRNHPKPTCNEDLQFHFSTIQAIQLDYSRFISLTKLVNVEFEVLVFIYYRI
ncbi:hypothetical protein GW17_00059565 [Ensete ventricosum]|nr:hypothetical protein GW17_00059565 [Ensete ventricosum]